MRNFLGLCSAALLATTSAAAVAQSDGRTAAYVFSKSGKSPSTIWVERGGDGARQPLSTGTKLQAGDEVHATGRAGRVVLRVANQGEVRVSAVSGPYTIPGRTDEGITGAVGEFIRKVGWAFGMSDGHQEKRTSVGRRSEGAVELAAHPLLANTSQTLVSGSKPVVIWCGLGTQVTPLFDSAGSLQASDFGIAVMPAANNEPDGYVITGSKSAADSSPTPSHRIAVDWIDIAELPRPEWLSAPAANIAETTGWGLWLATEAPANYRLAGLSMLSEVQDQSIEASYALDALATCPPA